MNHTDLKVIAFDVFGTVVDWFGSVSPEVKQLHPEVDGGAFALAWREGYVPAMRKVMEDGAWVILDDLHRNILDQVLIDFGLDGMPEAERRHLNKVWHRLHPWPDAAEGLERLKSEYIVCTLSNGNIGLLTRMAKFGGLTWDCVLSAENFERYKPHPDAYLGVARTFSVEPGEVMLAAAHQSDLEGARSCGLRTAYIERPHEYGPDYPKDVSPNPANTIHATNIIHLAKQVGC